MASTEKFSSEDVVQLRVGWDDDICVVEVAGELDARHREGESSRGINIESMDSETTPAPISGIPLFTMTAEVAVPPDLVGRAWETGLDDLSSHLNLEIRVAEVKSETSAAPPSPE